MPQILRRRKAKRSQKKVLVKRRHFLTNFHETKSYKPLCKQLQNNNNLLAKALSKERHESQLLFSQNVALIAEVQDLGLACNKRDAIISNVLKNAKEMLKMLVTMSGYLTNTISSCQEFAESVTTNMQMTYNSNGRKESLKRLSIKSPTRGIVKPMVSGYTITKPTINLSRLNMQHINNSSNLSIIPEIRTPPRNQELDNSISSNDISVRRTCKNGRSYRMPERLTATSPRDSDESERRFSERNNGHSTEGKTSGRMSGKLSKSKSRLSKNSNSRCSIENFEHIGNPRVKLNDVSKLLQNSHTINIRMLTKNQNNQEVDGSKCNDVVNSEDSQAEIIPATSPSNGSVDSNNKTTENKNEQNNNELNTTNEHRSSNWEDPLEGPSWLFNNSQVVPSFRSKDKKTDDINVSNGDSMSLVLTEKESGNVFNNDKTMQEISRRANHANNFENSEQVNNEGESNVHQRNENNEICNEIVVTDTNDNECKNAPVINFITQRRGYFESEDEDDFTLIYTKQPRNMHFDINDLKLPVLEQSVLKPIAPTEPEPEITTTFRKISEICPIPSVSHNLVCNTLDESAFNRSTVKLPLLLNDSEDVESTPVKKKSKMSQRKSKKKKETAAESNDDFIANIPSFKKNNSYKRKKNKPVKDPSTVKVVLQKLNESDVKSRTPSPNETVSHNSNQNLSLVSSRADNSSDSESSTSTNSLFACNRPRRKRTPVTYHEPNLQKKLRRNQ